ncbi:leucyl aminopeptidase [Chryseobacterium sp. Leaf180]|uniref:M28 family peptidase n=1 Tax=Chryseobacterium sp. Leaf180 TaxID=1736289 RepID=UPI0006F55D43|nr:M28 family peptidase [Chryseobacterium sp. Leaf180]KQR94651.1 leucyl aminopeptidase [Chryseobacterium sp. Leaf180]
MKKILTLLLFSGSLCSVSAQSFIQAYQNRANLVTQSNITGLLQEFGNLGVKTTGSAANTDALNWLKNKYIALGYTNSQITEDTFTFASSTSKNLIITKTGTVYPNTYVIICGHYDTINGPGVSDNGSGTSILLEAARILKNIPTEYSIKFIHFSGEEQGLLGSTHYVNNVVFQNNIRQFDIRLVINIDQVGGQLGNVNNNIKCESDQGGQVATNNALSQTFTNQLAVCTSLYSPLQTTLSNAFSSDYVPFENKGDIITGFYETTRSYNEHSPNDTFVNVDPVYVFNVGKAAVGALQHFAVASTQNLSTSETSSSELYQIEIYPNPAKDVLNLKLPKDAKDFSVSVSDASGRTIFGVENQKSIDISSLTEGVYIANINLRNQTVSRKFVVKK